MDEGATRGRVVREGAAAFAAAGLDTPGLDARRLAEAALALDPIAFVTDPDAPVSPDAARRFAALVARRLAGEPVARLLGRAEFRGLPFVLSPGTLVPRPDSETVVETALAAAPSRPEGLRILDLGTGSGCLLVALLHERPDARGCGIDRSPDALGTARRNARANGVGDRALFAASDWAAALGGAPSGSTSCGSAGAWDLVVANPPYIASAVMPTLAPEVARHDPAAALDGGPDGLDAYRRILPDLPRLLAPGGRAVVEIGWDQGDALPALARAHGLAAERVVRDPGGHPRAVVLSPSAPGSAPRFPACPPAATSL